jgi:hypothetical protein
MKFITPILFLLLALSVHAAPLGSINDPVLGNSQNAPASGNNAAIQAQINALQSDIEQRRKVLDHQHSSGTHGAYQDIIDAEVKQIAALKLQMAK